jgi:hypothetical protein
MFLASLACQFVLGAYDLEPNAWRGVTFAMLYTATYLLGRTTVGAPGWVIFQILLFVCTIGLLREHPEAIPPGALAIPYLLTPILYIAGIALLLHHWLTGRGDRDPVAQYMQQ